jgi:hypothetical protein
VLPVGAGAEVGGSPLPLVRLVRALLWLTRWVGGAMVVHCPVLRGNTSEHSCHNLPLLGFLASVDYIVRGDDIANKLWKCPSSVERHALLQLGGKTDHEAVLLLIRVHLVRRILHQVVEYLGVVLHITSTLL